MHGITVAVATLAIATLMGGCDSGAPDLLPASITEMAADAEARVRAEFQDATGREAESSRELLQYIDRRTLELPTLDDRSLEALVQAYGATLGQLLIKEHGGRWVRQTVDGASQDGVELPNGKVAFVFNRAYRRIADKDPIGFEAYFDSADR